MDRSVQHVFSVWPFDDRETQNAQDAVGFPGYFVIEHVNAAHGLGPVEAVNVSAQLEP